MDTLYCKDCYWVRRIDDLCSDCYEDYLDVIFMEEE